MYCPKCGKGNPKDARFCMHCGADLSGYTVEVAPKIEVSPKISVSAKAEGGVALKWKLKPIGYAERGKHGKLPIYDEVDLAVLENKPFCPLCGNYDCLKPEGKDFKLSTSKRAEEMGDAEIIFYATLGGERKVCYCLACNKYFLLTDGI